MTLHDEYIKLVQRYGYKLKNNLDARRVFDSLEKPLECLDVKEALDLLKKTLESQDKHKREEARLTLEMVKKCAVAEGISSEDFFKNIFSNIHRNSNLINDYGGHLNRFLRQQGRNIPADVYFNEFPTGDFNACAIRSKNGYICLLNDGLLQLVKHISYSCFYPLKVDRFDHGHNTVIFSVDMSTLERIDDNAKYQHAIKNIIETIYKYNRYQLHEHPIFELEFEHGADLMAEDCSTAMRTFVVAHELAHILLGHFNDYSICSINTPLGTLEVCTKDQEKELEADAEAQKILLAIDASDKANISSFDAKDKTILSSFADGGICFLAVAMMIEHFSSMIETNSCTSSTHPPTLLRLNSLIKILESGSGKIEQQQLFWRFSIFHNFLNTLKLSKVVHRTSNGFDIELPSKERKKSKLEIEEEVRQRVKEVSGKLLKENNMGWVLSSKLSYLYKKEIDKYKSDMKTSIQAIIIEIIKKYGLSFNEAAEIMQKAVKGF